MKPLSGWARALALAAATAVSLGAAGGAWAHANVSPPIVKAKQGQLFTLAVPTEEEGLTTTQIELTPPPGFSIDSFVPAPGWKRDVEQTGSGEEAEIEKVTWSGGSVPTGEDAVFQFLGRTDAAESYAFKVKQTYSDGSVVSWAGDESSDTPAPTIEARSSLGGGGSSIRGIVALIVAAVALAASLAALVGGGGRRPVA